MMRWITVLAFLPVLVLAAPVPKEAQFAVRGWGDPVDPLKDCKFDVDKDGKLTITVPGKGRDLSYHTGVMSSPRVLREFEGDFSLEARVDGEWPLGKNSTVEGRPPFFGAGLFVAEDDKNYIRLEKARWESSTNKNCYVSFENWGDGEWGRHGSANDGELDAAKPVRLRLTRKGSTVTAAFTQDDKSWTALTALEVKLAAKLKIGVCAVHTTDAEFKPVFSDLKVEGLAK